MVQVLGPLSRYCKSTLEGNVRYLATCTKIFDRSVKRRQRNWSVNSKDYYVCQYVKDEVGYQIADKILDLKKYNEVCISLGCDGGHIRKYISKEKVGVFIECDMSEELIRRCNSAGEGDVPLLSAVADEEQVPFKDNCADLVVSSLCGHWINNLPRWFSRCFDILREDCPAIGAVLAGDTLQELRISLQLAEIERLGGIGAHVSPFLIPSDVGSLMSRAGFTMITLDSDRIESMGESNASKRRTYHIRRDVLIAADAIYKSMFAGKSRGYPATFHVISFIGWKPGPTMPKPAKRGSQNISFKDLSKFVSEGFELKNSDNSLKG